MSNQFIQKMSFQLVYKNPSHKFELKSERSERAALRDKTPVSAQKHTPYSEDRSTWD